MELAIELESWIKIIGDTGPRVGNTMGIHYIVWFNMKLIKGLQASVLVITEAPEREREIWPVIIFQCKLFDLNNCIVHNS